MRVEIVRIKDLMTKALEPQFDKKEIEQIIEVYLGGELGGHITHGLAAFPAFAKQDFTKCKKPEVIKETHSLYFVEANSNCGITLGFNAADIAIEKAKGEGVSMSILRNICDWVRPGAIAKYIANKDMIGIVSNDGSGRSLAPPGGVDPTLGTNPLAYGLPTNKKPLVVEMASAKRAWGNVRRARKNNTEVPGETFLTSKGEYARLPDEVHSVLPFGDHKGFALALLIEVMNGSMIGDGMMPDSDAGSYSNSWPDNSGTIIVIDPSFLGDLDEYKKETTKALEYIKSSATLPGEQIRIPGEHSSDLYEQKMAEGSFELDDDVYQQLVNL